MQCSFRFFTIGCKDGQFWHQWQLTHGCISAERRNGDKVHFNARRRSGDRYSIFSNRVTFIRESRPRCSGIPSGQTELNRLRSYAEEPIKPLRPNLMLNKITTELSQTDSFNYRTVATQRRDDKVWLSRPFVISPVRSELSASCTCTYARRISFRSTRHQASEMV